VNKHDRLFSQGEQKEIGGGDAVICVEITQRCNMKCRHCSRSCTEKGEDMSLDTFIAAMIFSRKIVDFRNWFIN
jgi:MoaA/NifB/PqqE/SkfB family radical SAM enzyme